MNVMMIRDAELACHLVWRSKPTEAIVTQQVKSSKLDGLILLGFSTHCLTITAPYTTLIREASNAYRGMYTSPKTSSLSPTTL